MPVIRIAADGETIDQLRLLGDNLSLDTADLTVRLIIRAIQVDCHFRRSGLLGVRPSDVPASPGFGGGTIVIEVDLDDFVMDLFEELCVWAMRSPADLAAILVHALAGANRRQVERTGWPLCHHFPEDMREEAIDTAVGHGVDAITGRIRHGHDPIWSVDRPFPLSDTKCAALVRGHAVKWDGDPKDLDDLPGMYETRDGYVMVRRS